jgi:aspartyl-tRNA(Asn)/glutamyl-tRNA(Gln) amidotransferase subunit A
MLALFLFLQLMGLQINEYHTALKNNTITCIQQVTYYLEQIKLTKHLNIYLEVYEQEALLKAAQLDEAGTKGEPLKKLHGVVIAIKDVIVYKDHTVTAASKILKGYKSPFTATALQYLIDEDAIIIGMLNCDEFAMGGTNENSHYGAVKNPVNHEHVPGGSSGGSAAAIAANTCMIALGSDTGGSVRQPADYCGVYGFKPMYGGISRYGLIAYGSSFDQIGILAHNIPDIQTVFEIMQHKDDLDSTSISLAKHKAKKFTDKLRIGYFKDALEHPALQQEIKEGIKAHLATLEKNGHTLVPFDFDLINYVVPTYYILTTAEAASNFSRFDGVRYGYRGDDIHALKDQYVKTRTQGFGKEVKKRIMMGNFVLSAGYYDAYFTRAQKVRNVLYNNNSEIFKTIDVLAMPVVPHTAPKLNAQLKDPIAMYAADIYNVYANLVGISSLAIPLNKDKQGMPFGMQFMADAYNDYALLNALQHI